MTFYVKYTRLDNSSNLVNLHTLFMDKTSEYELYTIVKENWTEIISNSLSSCYLASLSYLLMSYTDYDRLEQLYERYPTLEVASNFIRLLINMGKSEQISSFLSQYLEIEEPIESKIELIGWGMFYYSQTQQIEKLKEFEIEFKKLFEKLKEKLDPESFPFLHLKIYKLYIESNVLYYIGEHDKSIKLSKQAIDLLLKNNLKDTYLLGSLYNVLAINYSFTGNILEKEMLKKVKETFEKEKMDRGVALAKGNLAYTYIREGKFEEAMDLLLEFDEIMRNYGEIRNILLNYSDIYLCLKSLGKMEEAERNLDIAIQMIDEYNLPTEDIFIDATEFYAIQGDIEKAEFYLNKYISFVNIDDKEAKRVNAIKYIYQGFIELKKRNIYDAEKNLKEGLNIARKHSVVPLILQALIYLIELNISKYRIEFDQLKKNEIVEEIEIISQECIAILKNYSNIYHMIKFQQLLSIAYILSGKYSSALSLLEELEQTCIEFSLDKALEEVKNLRKLALSADNYSNGEKKLIERTLEDEMQQYSMRAIREVTLLQNPPKTPSFLSLLVIKENGLPCFSYNFTEKKFATDELLLSGLINAIQKFSSEISWKKGNFRLIAHSDYILLLEPMNDFSIALFVDGYDPSFREKMKEFAEYVKPVIYKLKDQSYLEGEVCFEIEENLKKIVEQIFLN